MCERMIDAAPVGYAHISMKLHVGSGGGIGPAVNHEAVGVNQCKLRRHGGYKQSLTNLRPGSVRGWHPVGQQTSRPRS